MGVQKSTDRAGPDPRNTKYSRSTGRIDQSNEFEAPGQDKVMGPGHSSGGSTRVSNNSGS